MASSNGQQTQQQQQQKISPRKFSEKIALLNKKEAEGNAEFEEIIKEVQATRSSASNSLAPGSLNYGGQQQATFGKGSPSGEIDRLQALGISKGDRCDELEEVFQNLIKCVGQYEQELQEGKQHQRQQINHLPEENLPEGLSALGSSPPASTVMNSNNDELESNNNNSSSSCARSMSVHGVCTGSSSCGASTVTLASNFNSTDHMPLNHSTSVNMPNVSQLGQDRSTVVALNPLYQLSGGAPAQQQQRGKQNNFSGTSPLAPTSNTTLSQSGSANCFQSTNFYGSPSEVNSNYCRARVTSVGSASYKQMRLNSNLMEQPQLQQQMHQPFQPLQQFPMFLNQQQQHQQQPQQQQQPANCRYQCSSQQDAWIMSSSNDNSMYLRPACDKSWNKSCSDPALHNPVHGQTIRGQSSCSENLLMEVMAVEYDDNQVVDDDDDNNDNINAINNDSIDSINITLTNRTPMTAITVNEQRQENLGPRLASAYLVNPSQQANVNETVVKKFDYTIDNEISTSVEQSSISSCNNEGAEHYFQISGSLQQQQQQQRHQQQQVNSSSGSQSRALNRSVSGHDGQSLQPDQLELQKFTDNDGSMMKDLPGIKICAIDDEMILMKSNANNIQQSNCSSNQQHGTVSANLVRHVGQFGMISGDKSASDQLISSNCFHTVQHNPSLRSNLDRYDANIEYSHQHQPLERWTSAICQLAIDSREPTTCANSSSIGEQINSYTSSATTNWNNIISTNAGDSQQQICTSSGEPNNNNDLAKVANLLSNSDCGLVFEPSNRNEATSSYNNINNNNICRSRSHNSINFITKNKMPKSNYMGRCNFDAGGTGAGNEHDINYSTCNDQQYEHYWNQFSLHQHQGVEAKMKGCISEISMKPQLGSMSPIDSSSNLTSPQSEQNSPGSTLEYTEYMPFPQAHVQTATSRTGRAALRGSEDNTSSSSAAYVVHPSDGNAITDNIRSHSNAQECSYQLQQDQFGQTIPQQQQLATFNEQSCPVTCSVSQSTSSTYIGPCQSPSSSRRLQNQQACRGLYLPLPSARGVNGKN